METLSRYIEVAGALPVMKITDTSVSTPVTTKLKVVEYGTQVSPMVSGVVTIVRLPAESVTLTIMSIVAELLDVLR